MDEVSDVEAAPSPPDSSPPVLRTVVVCLTALAGVAAVGGMVAGVVLLTSTGTVGGGALVVQVCVTAAVVAPQAPGFIGLFHAATMEAVQLFGVSDARGPCRDRYIGGAGLVQHGPHQI